MRPTRRHRALACTAAVIFAVGVATLPFGSDAAEEGRIAYVAVSDGTWQLHVAEADGSEARQITSSSGDKTVCSWFPDGRSVLVNVVGKAPRRIDVGSGEESELALGLEGIADAVVSPDGRRVAFSAAPTGTIDGNEIWVSRLDGSRRRRLTRMPELAHEPAWSDDGRWLYFLAGGGSQSHDIWRVGVAGSPLEQLTVGKLYHFEVAVSPSGELAFSSNRSGNYEIWVHSEGKEPRALTRDPALDAEPAWSPSGGTLLFTSTRGGPPNLWRVDASGGEAIQITHHEEGARSPAWWHPYEGERR